MPAIVLTLGGIFLPDTPNSLIQRGKEAEGRRVLVKIRGTTEVDEELEDIKAAVKQANSVRLQNTFLLVLLLFLLFFRCLRDCCWLEPIQCGCKLLFAQSAPFFGPFLGVCGSVADLAPVLPGC